MCFIFRPLPAILRLPTPRPRRLYGKYLEWCPHSCYAWSKFAELERMVGEEERARAVYQLAVAQVAASRWFDGMAASPLAGRN